MKRKLVCVVFGTLFALGILFLKQDASAKSGQANKTDNAKPANPGWKNIQVLQELNTAPENDLYATMDFISSSLGVSCDYCHAGSYDVDARKTKQIARDMIKMTRTINETNFGGRLVVTCNSCHQGSIRPNGKPSPWNKTPEQNAAYQKIVEALSAPVRAPSAGETAKFPDADKVLADYRKAVGTVSAKSIYMSGAVVAGLRGSGKVEAYFVLPNQMLVSTTASGIELQAILNGDHGWFAGSVATRLAMSPDQMETQRRAMEAFLPVKYSVLDAAPKVTGIEKIGDRSCYVVESDNGKARLQLYFDKESALIYKMRREVKTVLGTSVAEYYFDDYRDVNGVKLAYSIISLSPTFKTEYRINEIKTDIQVDAVKFEPPPPKEHKEIKIDAKIFDAYVGDYQLAPGTVFTVSRDGDRFFINQSGSQRKLELFAESETDFFMKVQEVQLTFVRNDKGEVTQMILRQNKIERQLTRMK